MWQEGEYCCFTARSNTIEHWIFVEDKIYTVFEIYYICFFKTVNERIDIGYVLISKGKAGAKCSDFDILAD